MATTARPRRDHYATNPALEGVDDPAAALRLALTPHRFQRLRLTTRTLPGVWPACDVVGVLESFEIVQGHPIAWVMAGQAGRVAVPLAAVLAWRVLDGWVG